MKEKIILKSVHPSEYPDLVVECRVIPNDKIGEYLATIPEERKFYAYKSEPVMARRGKVGEVIKTTLKTIVDGKEYILSEEENIVKERTYTKKETLSDGTVVEEEVTEPDVVVENHHSTLNEQYVIKHQKFISTYYSAGEEVVVRGRFCVSKPVFAPKYDSRLLTEVDENVIIMTLWGAHAVCLAGSYIVTYNAEENDYNTIERGAFEFTYVKEQTKEKIK